MRITLEYTPGTDGDDAAIARLSSVIYQLLLQRRKNQLPIPR